MGTAFAVPNDYAGLLGHFPRGADPPANNRRATNLSVRLPTSSSLRAVLAARAGGRGVWARVSGRRVTRVVGRGSAGGRRQRGMERGER